MFIFVTCDVSPFAGFAWFLERAVLKLLAEHNLEFLTLKGCYRGSSESTLVKMPQCWKSHTVAHMSKTSYHMGLYNAKNLSKVRFKPVSSATET